MRALWRRTLQAAAADPEAMGAAGEAGSVANLGAAVESLEERLGGRGLFRRFLAAHAARGAAAYETCSSASFLAAAAGILRHACRWPVSPSVTASPRVNHSFMAAGGHGAYVPPAPHQYPSCRPNLALQFLSPCMAVHVSTRMEPSCGKSCSPQPEQDRVP